MSSCACFLFLEVQFVSGRKDPEWWGCILKKYVKNASSDQFYARQTPDLGTVDDEDDEHYWRDPLIELSADDIVQEGLRLYPPMRRVYRACNRGPPQEPEHPQDKSNANSSTSKASIPEIRDMDEAVKSPYCRILAAELESCLLNVDVWGKQAHRFDPTRWCKPTKDKITRFLTFGPDQYDYPAAEEYGARMVGLLVGALFVALQGKDESSEMTWRLDCRDPKVMAALEAKERLNLERHAYDELVLVGTR